MCLYKYADGGKYRGTWKHSQPHGAGCVIFPNGVKYTGAFINGKFDACGVMEMSKQGYKDEGEFKHGYRSGQGTLTFLYILEPNILVNFITICVRVLVLKPIY